MMAYKREIQTVTLGLRRNEVMSCSGSRKGALKQIRVPAAREMSQARRTPWSLRKENLEIRNLSV